MPHKNSLAFLDPQGVNGKKNKNSEFKNHKFKLHIYCELYIHSKKNTKISYFFENTKR